MLLKHTTNLTQFVKKAKKGWLFYRTSKIRFKIIKGSRCL
jgi:hypothetical protein